MTTGRHEVKIVRNGLFDWHGDVFVDSAETTSVWAQLQARPQAWYQRRWVWTTVGVVALGATGGAVYEVERTKTVPAAKGSLTIPWP